MAPVQRKLEEKTRDILRSCVLFSGHGWQFGWQIGEVVHTPRSFPVHSARSYLGCIGGNANAQKTNVSSARLSSAVWCRADRAGDIRHRRDHIHVHASASQPVRRSLPLAGKAQASGSSLEANGQACGGSCAHLPIGIAKGTANNA